MLLAALTLFLPTTIDYSTVAKPLPVVLRELSSVTGEEWRATKALEGELLVVRVEDVTKDDLRKHVADAIVGKWYQDDGGAWILRPDEAKLRKRADTRRRAVSKQLDEQIKKYYDEFKDLPGTSESQLIESAADWLDNGSAVGNWLLARALQQLDCYEISGLPENEEVVYSTTNNRMQRPLRLGRNVLSQALQTQHRLADAAARADVDEPEVGTYEYEVRQRNITKWRGPLRVVVVLGSEYESLGARCLVVDGTNQVVDVSTASFMFEQEATIKVADEHATTKLVYSPDTVMFERFSTIRASTPQFEDIDPKFLAKMREPSKHDPLSFTVSDYLLEIGKHTDWNIVARPFDELHDIYIDDDPTTLAIWLEAIQLLTSIHVEQKDNWLVVGSSGFLTKKQIDRKAMEDFIATGQDQIPSLSEVANYARVSADNLLELIYLAPFVGIYPDWTYLKFYGTMPEPLRKRMWNGETLALGELTQPAARCIEDIVLNGDAYEDVEVMDGNNLHITDFLPNGIPRTTQIQSKVTSDYCLLQTKPRNLRSRSYSRTLDSIAESAARRQYYDSAESANFPWSLAPFIVGRNRDLDLTIQVGPYLYGDILSDPDLKRTGTPVTGEPLPEGMQKSFDDAAARHLRRMIEEGGGR